MPTPNTVLVTGATGAVGPRIVEALVTAGHSARVLALDPPKPGTLPAGVEFCSGNIIDPVAVRDAMQGCAGVIHMAALLHIVNPPPELRTKYEAVNIGGTRCIVEAASAAGVKRVVFFSTVAVYGKGRPDVLTEDTEPTPDTFYGETKLTAEKIVLDARGANGTPLGTVLRMGAIYGSGIKGNYRRLTLALARRRFVPVGAGQNRRSLIYDRDAATAAVLALRIPQAAGQVYNVTDNQFHTLADIIAAICTALGRPPPRLRIPLAAAHTAAGCADWLLRLAGRRPKLRAAIDKYVEEVMVSGEKINRELGFIPKYDLQTGWRECVSEMRKTGELPPQ